MRESRDIQLTPAERRRLISISLTRPLNMTALAAGGIVSAAATSPLLLAATLIVYALLAVLTFKDPLFRNQALQSSPSNTDALSPERKATWLPRGQTRKTVEAALVAYRRSLKEIDNSEDVAKDVMSDSVEGLHTAAHSLVELALGREKARHELEHARQRDEPDTGELASLQKEIEKADQGIREISAELNNLRTRLVRLSVSSQNSSRDPEEITRALRELEARAEALDALLPGHRTD